MMEVETLTAQDVSKLLGISPLKVTSAILSGQLPIGFVVVPDPGTKEKTRTVIIKKRFERYINGEDLQLVAKGFNSQKGECTNE